MEDLHDTVCTANMSGVVICLIVVFWVFIVRMNQQRQEILSAITDNKLRGLAVSHVIFLFGSLLYVFIEFLNSISCMTGKHTYNCNVLIPFQISGWLMARCSMYYWLVERTHVILDRTVETQITAWLRIVGKAIISLMLLFSFLILISTPIGRSHTHNHGYCVNAVPFAYNATIIIIDAILTLFVMGLFSYSLGVAIVNELKEMKGGQTSGSNILLSHQLSFVVTDDMVNKIGVKKDETNKTTETTKKEEKKNDGDTDEKKIGDGDEKKIGDGDEKKTGDEQEEEKEEQKSLLSPTRSTAFERNERLKLRVYIRNRALLKFYFTLSCIALLVSFLLFIALLYSGVAQLLMYSVAVSAVCFSLMYNANWGYIPACCCCCLREPILALQDFKIQEDQTLSPLEETIRERSDHWIRYICIPLDTCDCKTLYKNLKPFWEHKPEEEEDKELTISDDKGTKDDIVPPTKSTETDSKETKPKEKKLKETKSKETKSPENQALSPPVGSLGLGEFSPIVSPNSPWIKPDVSWLEEEYDELVWEGKLEEICDAIRRTKERDLLRLWSYFDRKDTGYIDSRQTLCKLVYSLFCVYVKRGNKKVDPPHYPVMRKLIESIVDELRPHIGTCMDDDGAAQSNQERISRDDFVRNIDEYMKQAVKQKKLKMAVHPTTTAGGPSSLGAMEDLDLGESVMETEEKTMPDGELGEKGTSGELTLTDNKTYLIHPDKTKSETMDSEEKKEAHGMSSTVIQNDLDLVEDGLDLVINDQKKVQQAELLIQKLKKIDITVLDTKKDNKIHRAEFLKYFIAQDIQRETTENIFEQLDKNKDGFITPSQYSQWLETIDVNKIQALKGK